MKTKSPVEIVHDYGVDVDSRINGVVTLDIHDFMELLRRANECD